MTFLAQLHGVELKLPSSVVEEPVVLDQDMNAAMEAAKARKLAEIRERHAQ